MMEQAKQGILNEQVLKPSVDLPEEAKYRQDIHQPMSERRGSGG
jgi:hypothetical protein